MLVLEVIWELIKLLIRHGNIPVYIWSTEYGETTEQQMDIITHHDKFDDLPERILLE